MAPGVFVRANVGRFAKIGRTWILCCVQIANVDPDPVRYAVVVVSVVVVGG